MATEQGIDYGALMHEAMRGLIRSVLGDVAQRGLPGAHHFFITFDTGAEGVAIAPWLKERHPEEMTIVLQNWFDALEVDEDQFAVTLNFGDQPERLVIPLAAIRTFVDPSVEFGLRLETHDEAAEEGDAAAPAAEETADAGAAESRDAEAAAQDAGGDAEEKPESAKIVSLDQFRRP